MKRFRAIQNRPFRYDAPGARGTKLTMPRKDFGFGNEAAQRATIFGKR
jgi:hypothetical protein